MGVRETAVDEAYALILEFESPLIPFETWQEKREKIERFFGPGVRVEVTEGEESRVEVAMIATPQAVASV